MLTGSSNRQTPDRDTAVVESAIALGRRKGRGMSGRDEQTAILDADRERSVNGRRAGR